MAPPPVVGFSDLTTEALEEIARRAGPLGNVLCSAVCRSWRRALRTTRLHRLGRQPSLPHRIYMYQGSYWKEGQPPVVEVSRPYCRDSGRWAVKTVMDDGEVASARILGSSYGWVITVDNDTWAMSLLDPFTGRSFPLPPFTDSSRAGKQLWTEFRWGREMFRKAALAPGRRLGTYAVMLLHSGGRGMSYLAPGATSWATLRPPRGMPHKYLDVIFHKGAFYTVSSYAEVSAWVPDGSGSLRTRRLTSPRREQVWAVLTESVSRDGVLMVSSTDTRDHDNYLSYGFRQRQYRVHRCAERERRWLPVENLELGELTIVVGGRCSFCVPRSYGYDVGDHGHRNERVQPTSSHWFLPYVARLGPAFW
ncbi:hypothetical protein ACQJBY_045098 [Aegilops geniculata]